MGKLEEMERRIEELEKRIGKPIADYWYPWYPVLPQPPHYPTVTWDTESTDNTSGNYTWTDGTGTPKYKLTWTAIEDD